MSYRGAGPFWHAVVERLVRPDALRGSRPYSVDMGRDEEIKNSLLGIYSSTYVHVFEIP